MEHDRKLFEDSFWDFPPLSSKELEVITDVSKLQKLQDYFWECGYQGYLTARKELQEQLKDPVMVHSAMLRGEIAAPDPETMKHIWGNKYE